MTDKLYEVRETLADERRWCKKEMAMTARGRPVPPWSPHARRFDIEGACYHVAGRHEGGGLAALIRARTGVESLSRFNDRASHDGVLALLDRALGPGDRV